jgi:hypothetical protein
MALDGILRTALLVAVILALAASGVTARSSSTNSFAAISVINGPIRTEIGMNSGVGAMGPYNHANATIGRAFSLLSQNLQGGSVLPAREYWDNQWIQYLLRPRAVAGIEPYAPRFRAAPDEPVQIFDPEDIHIVVAGGETPGAWKMISGALRGTVSIDAWR